MDLAFFLKQRVEFIRQFYTISSAGFIERKRLIEAKEKPFVPPYSEDAEPPFLEEWLKAEESLQVLGNMCISMLAAIFHLYFKEWESQTGIAVDDSLKADFKKGWLNGYRAYFAHHFQIRFEDSPTNLTLLEELVLARNKIQHPESILMNTVRYSDSDLKKLPNLFFVDKKHASLFAEIEDKECAWLIAPHIQVTEEMLFTVLSEVTNFAEWMENAEVDPSLS